MNEGVKSNLSNEESLTAEELCSKGVEYCESEEYGKAGKNLDYPPGNLRFLQFASD